MAFVRISTDLGDILSISLFPVVVPESSQGRKRHKVAPAGMTDLFFWGGSAGCECSASSHGIE